MMGLPQVQYQQLIFEGGINRFDGASAVLRVLGVCPICVPVVHCTIDNSTRSTVELQYYAEQVQVLRHSTGTVEHQLVIATSTTMTIRKTSTPAI